VRDVADFRNHREGKEMFDPFVTGQGLNRFLLGVSGGTGPDLLVIFLKNRVQSFPVAQQYLQVHVETGPDVALMVRSSQLSWCVVQ